MKFRLFYLVVCGLVLAICIHIVIVLLIPLFGEKDAAKRIMESAKLNQFEVLTGNEQFGQSNGDPFFKLAVCRFDLAASGVEVNGGLSNLFWSASVFNARGRVIYSLSQRTAIANQLRFIVVNPVQMANIRQLKPEELETSIIVETGVTSGFIIIRALLPDSSWETHTEEFLSSLQCSQYSEVNQ